jgi:hypothetical protein
MGESAWRNLTRTPRRWLQFIGWFIGVEIFANVFLVSTVSGVGWDDPVRKHRALIQIVILALALAFGLYQAFSRSIAWGIARRVRLLSGVVERNEQLLTQVNRLEQLVTGAREEIETAAQERDRAVAQAQRAPAVLTQLAEALQTAIVADHARRQSAQLYRCHRSPRGELICTLPIGRRQGIVQGMEFTVLDGQERRPIAAFRVTGAADAFAACTLVDGAGWILTAEQYTNAPLPEHTLSFPLPEAAGEMDADEAGRMLRLVAAYEPAAQQSPAYQSMVQGDPR